MSNQATAAATTAIERVYAEYGRRMMIYGCFQLLIEQFECDPKMQHELVLRRNALYDLLYPPCPSAPGSEGGDCATHTRS